MSKKKKKKNSSVDNMYNRWNSRPREKAAKTGQIIPYTECIPDDNLQTSNLNTLLLLQN